MRTPRSAEPKANAPPGPSAERQRPAAPPRPAELAELLARSDPSGALNLAALHGNAELARALSGGAHGVLSRQQTATRRAPAMRAEVAQQVAEVHDAVARGDYDTVPTPLPPGFVGPPAPAGAFACLNGLDPNDLVETMKALGKATREQLWANFAKAGRFDKPRLEAALRAASWDAKSEGIRAVDLLDAVRNAGAGSLAGGFALLAGLPRSDLMRTLGTLDQVTLGQLLAHVGDAPAPDQGKLRDVLTDLTAAPNLVATDVIDLEGLHGDDRIMADIYNTKGQFLEDQARALGIGTSTAAGIMRAESGGMTFNPITDKPLVRFENHVFWNRWGQHHQAEFNAHFDFNRTGHAWENHRWRAAPTDSWEGFHGHPAAEWRVVEFAAGLADRETAYRCMSVGAGQVMGFNFASLGYASAEAMVDAMVHSERAQIRGIFDYIQHTPGLTHSVQIGDFEELARRYNGPGQAANYAAEIRNFSARYRRLTAGKRHVIP